MCLLHLRCFAGTDSWTLPCSLSLSDTLQHSFWLSDRYFECFPRGASWLAALTALFRHITLKTVHNLKIIHVFEECGPSKFRRDESQRSPSQTPFRFRHKRASCACRWRAAHCWGCRARPSRAGGRPLHSARPCSALLLS